MLHNVYVLYQENKRKHHINDYLLLYNNFESRELALDYCNKYLLFLYDCIILNAENID